MTQVLEALTVKESARKRKVKVPPFVIFVPPLILFRPSLLFIKMSPLEKYERFFHKVINLYVTRKEKPINN